MFNKLKKIRDEKVHKLLWGLTEKYPHKTRIISLDNSPYLRRFYLTPRRLDEHGEDSGNFLGFGVYLHYFYRGDEDMELHNHPWHKALSLILCGGYIEERRDNKTMKVNTKEVNAGDLNLIRHTDFHRVTLNPKNKHTWSLFFSGTRIQNWGFWDRDTKEYIPYENFVEKSQQGYKNK